MPTGKDSHLSGIGSSAGTTHSVYSASQREMVKEQLERLLASSLFRNSKRFPTFLRYTVNQALMGETAGLKERALAVAVFGRDRDYDTSTDPVVRVTAAEVRKRITQYYDALGHEHELRIAFERGSYVPEFRFVYDDERREPQTKGAASTGEKQSGMKQWLLLGCLGAPCLALFAFLLPSLRPTALDRFWSPIVSANNSALLCIPNPAPSPLGPGTGAGRASAATQSPPDPSQVMSLGDSVALSLVSAVLGRKHKDFRVSATEDVTLDDLKERSAVLIGAFDNQWTLRLASGLRFALGQDASYGYIADLRNPSSRQWALTNQGQPGNDAVDYGLVSRFTDPNTGRSVITVAGIHHFGTEAAAECITEENCLEAAAKLAPGDWRKNNLQIVLKTTVIGQNSGEPQVLAAYEW